MFSTGASHSGLAVPPRSAVSAPGGGRGARMDAAATAAVIVARVTTMVPLVPAVDQHARENKIYRQLMVGPCLSVFCPPLSLAPLAGGRSS